MINGNSSLRTLFFLLLIGFFSSSSILAQDTIRIGVLSNRGEAKSQQAWQETVDYLHDELPNYHFEITPLSFNKMEAAVKQKEIDLLFCNPANSILFEVRYGLTQIATLQKLYQGQEYSEYGSVFFTRKDNLNINRLTDLKGKKIAAVDRLSMGGCLLPRELLQTHGLNLEDDAKTLIFTQNHDEVVFTVLSGHADIGMVRTGILEEMVKLGDINLEDIKILHPLTYPNFPFLVSTDLIPEWPLTKLFHFSNDISLEIVRELYELSEQEQNNKSVSNYGWTFPADYSLVSEKLKSIQAPPFENIELSFKEKLAKDWNFFFLLFGLAIAFSLFVVFAYYLQNHLERQTANKKQTALMERFKDSSAPFLSQMKNFGAQCAQKKFVLKNYWTWSYLKWLFLVSLGYYLSVEFGLLFALGKSENTAIWFASGIGFIAVYALGYRIWPAIFLGAFAVSMSSLEVYNIDSSQIYLSVINSFNNVMEAVFGVYLIHRFVNKRPLFSTIKTTASFIILVAFLTSLITATIGTVAFTTLGDLDYFYGMLLTWWLGDAAGLLLVVPLILSWKKPEFSSSIIKQTLLLTVFLILLILVGAFVFQVGYHLAYLFLPFFIYFTFRFGRFFSLIMAFILGLVSVWVVIYLNIYWLWETPSEGLFYVRLFILILLLTILLVSAIIDEQNLAEERMRLYKKIVFHSNEAIAIIDPNGYYLEQNPAHEKLVGYSDLELEGRTPEIHLGEDAFNTIVAELSEKKVSVGEWISHTKQGDKPIDLSTFSVYNDDGEVICHVGIKRDITERKNAEDLLRKSEAEAWSLFKNAAIPVMIEDFSAIKIYIDKLAAAGLTDWKAYFDQNPKEINKIAAMIKVIDVNEKMIDVYGDGSKEQLLNHFIELFTEESMIIFQKEIIALAKGNFTFTSEIPIRNFQGETKHLILSLNIPPLYREKFERVIVSFVDITEIKRAENIQKALLNISNAANKAKNIEETIQTVSAELGSVIDRSNFFLALYDAEKDELSLPFIRSENHLPEKIAAKKTLTSLVIHKKSTLLFSQKEMEEMEEKGILNPVSKISKVWLGTPLKIKGEVIGAFVVQSYTNANAYTEKDKETLEIIANQIALSLERKQAEEDVLYSLEKAQESDRIKSAFLSSMSHELRTPLNAIVGFSNLIDNDMSKEQTIQFAEMIHKSGTNLLQIVDSIFEVSLLDEGAQKLVFDTHSFEDLINDVYQTVLTRQKVLNKTDITIKLKHNWTPEQEIYTDGAKFKHIFLHLLINALKFTPSGIINFGLEKIDKNGAHHFYVSDTGVGIPEEDISFIFDRFRMGDDTHNRLHEGMGVGLFICKKLIELLGGEIEVRSEKNTGSYFSFYLPLQKNKQIF